jgi:aminopeptidase YwaD
MLLQPADPHHGDNPARAANALFLTVLPGTSSSRATPRPFPRAPLPFPLVLILCALPLLFFALPLLPFPSGGREAHAQPTPLLLDSGTQRLFHEALSGETAKEYVIAISRFHRIQGSREYRYSANYILEVLREAGFGPRDAFIESFPSDGRVTYQTWQSPSGWDISQAELRMVAPFDERIVGYPEIAMSLMTYSNPGHARGELVWVGPGNHDAHYEAKDVAGRIVLCTGYGGDVHRLAVLKYGALAAVCYLDDDRAMLNPDMLAYTGLWPRTEELERVRFGFNLPRRQGERLRQMVESGQRVVLDATVEGIGLEPYWMDVVVAVIPGSDPDAGELVYSGHLDHPKESANDNASGSAAMMDMALTLKRLVDEGRLPQPKRTLRFLWVPEFYGMMAYVDAHPEMVGPSLGGKTLANLNLDMVGENLLLIPTKMILTRTPASIPSVLNDVVENMAEMVRRMEIRTPRGSISEPNIVLTPYSGGSDHNMFIDRKIPGMMLGHSPDYTHHTSEDTPDKVDPVELERSEILATATFWYLANLTEAQGVELAYLAGAGASERLGEAARRGVRDVLAAPPEDAGRILAEAENRLHHYHDWGKAAVRDVLNFNDAPDVAGAVDVQLRVLDQQASLLQESLLGVPVGTGGGRLQAVPPLARTVDDRVAVRLTRGPLAGGLPASRLSQERAAWYASPENPLRGSYAFELVNFMDGQRTVTAIRDALSAQYGPVPTEAVTRFVEDMVAAGLARWR